MENKKCNFLITNSIQYSTEKVFCQILIGVIDISRGKT